MINLLPKTEKENLAWRKRRNLVIIFGIIILTSLLCLFLALFSVKIHFEGERISQKVILEQEQNKFEQSEFKELAEELETVNQNFAKLDSFYGQKFYLTEHLERILEILPPKIILSSFSYQRSPSKITLSGTASSSEALLEFKKIIEREKDVEGVSLSPSDWRIEPREIEFRASFKFTSLETKGL